MNNANQDVLLYPSTLNGSVLCANMGTSPLITNGTMSNAAILTNLTSSWSILKNIAPQQALLNSVNHFGLSPTNLSSLAQVSFYLTIDGKNAFMLMQY